MFEISTTLTLFRPDPSVQGLPRSLSLPSILLYHALMQDSDLNLAGESLNDGYSEGTNLATDSCSGYLL